MVYCDSLMNLKENCNELRLSIIHLENIFTTYNVKHKMKMKFLEPFISIKTKLKLAFYL